MKIRKQIYRWFRYNFWPVLREFVITALTAVFVGFLFHVVLVDPPAYAGSLAEPITELSKGELVLMIMGTHIGFQIMRDAIASFDVDLSGKSEVDDNFV